MHAANKRSFVSCSSEFQAKLMDGWMNGYVCMYVCVWWPLEAENEG